MPAEPLVRGGQSIADAIGLPRRVVYSLAAEGRLPTFRLGRRLCASPTALREWRSKHLAEAASRRPVPATDVAA